MFREVSNLKTNKRAIIILIIFLVLILLATVGVVVAKNKFHVDGDGSQMAGQIHHEKR